MRSLEAEIASLLNSFSEENCSNTPDFILAAYMQQCLDAFNTAVKARDAWYGIAPRPGNAFAVEAVSSLERPASDTEHEAT